MYAAATRFFVFGAGCSGRASYTFRPPGVARRGFPLSAVF